MTTAPPRESFVEKYLLEQCRRSGLLCLKFVSPSRAGVPDRLVICPAATVFVELKRPGGRLRKLQKVTHEKMRRYGAEIHTINTRAGVDALITDLLARDGQEITA